MNFQIAEMIAEALRPFVVEAVTGVVREALTETVSALLRLLSVKEAAGIANVNPETIRRAIKRGGL